MFVASRSRDAAGEGFAVGAAARAFQGLLVQGRGDSERGNEAGEGASTQPLGLLGKLEVSWFFEQPLYRLGTWVLPNILLGREMGVE